jgi:hypothetical protein
MVLKNKFLLYSKCLSQFVTSSFPRTSAAVVLHAGRYQEGKIDDIDESIELGRKL